MSIKEDLHELVEHLSDADAENILKLLRDHPSRGQEVADLVPQPERWESNIVSGQDFINMPRKSVADLVAEQRVKPFRGSKSISNGLFLDDEVDDFVTTIREWRNEG